VFLRDKAAFFPNRIKRLERSVLVARHGTDNWDEDKVTQILQANGFMILKKCDVICNTELAEHFGFSGDDENISENM